MATDTWTGDAGDFNWTDAGNWSLGTVPTADDDVVIAIATVGIVDSQVVGAALTNDGSIGMDSNAAGQGGSSMTIAGALINANYIQVGSDEYPLSANDTVTAASFNNTGGWIDLYGSSTATATLNILSAASSGTQVGVLAGEINLSGDALVEFSGTSQITTIAASSLLSLTGTDAFIADAGINLTTNSALTGLTSISGDLYLYDGAKVNPGGAVTNYGQILLDPYSYYGGGAGMTIAGALTNVNYIQVGSADGLLSADDKLQVASVDNTFGTIDLYGSSTRAAELNVLSAASLSTQAGVLMGSVNLTGDSLVEFTGTSQITTIAVNSELSLTGTEAFVADAAINLTSNSALTGLTTLNGDLYLYDGAKVNTGGALTNNGLLQFDLYYGGQGGAGLVVTGVLTNTNRIQVGSSNNALSATDKLQAAGVDNTGGTIDLYGSSTAIAELNVLGAASLSMTLGVLAGNVNLSGDSVVEFAGTSQIATIAASSELSLTGTNAFVADASANPTSNSALTGLTTVTGSLNLYDGAKVNPGGALTNKGKILFDIDGGPGGAGMTVGGALTNVNDIQVGSSNNALSANDTLTVASFNNTGGTIDLYGSSTAATAELNVLSAASLSTQAGVLAGDVNLGKDALVEFMGTSQITRIAASSELTLTGTNAFVADAGINLTSNSALTGLTTISGSLYLFDGAKVNPGGALTNSGQLEFDVYGGQGAGMFVTGALTNTNYIQLGSSAAPSANDTLTAASFNNSGGTIDLYGSSNAAADLNVLSAASFGTQAGVLTGNVSLTGALVEFTGTSQITTIATGAELSLTGTDAFVADAGINLTSNSALTGLATIDGNLSLYNGAKVNPGGALTNNGQLEFDILGGIHGDQGGAGMTVGGVLTNTNYIQVGSGEYALSADDTLKAAGLINSGTIDLYGWTTATATLSIGGAATNSGTISATAYSNIADSGLYSQSSSGLLELGLLGTTVGQFATLSANALLLTGGVLNPSLEGLTLAAGETCNLLTFTPGDLTGLFGELSINGVNGNGVYDAGVTGSLSAGLVYNYSTGNIQLQIINAPTTQTETWIAGTGSWGTTADWSNGAPTFYSNVTIGSVGGANVTLSADATIDSLSIHATDTLTTASGHGLTVGGALSLVSGATLSGGGEVTIGGGGTIAGTVGGAGTLVIDGGATTIAGPAAISIANWTIANATTTIDENLSYSGHFSLGAGVTATLADFYLDLFGPAAFSSATVNGSDRLVTHGAATVSTLTIGGTVQWQNYGPTTQSGGDVSVGDNSGDFATLLNLASGVYEIADNSGIGHGSSTSSTVTNQGAFEKTGGTSTSTISASFIDTGTVTVTAGTLAFTGPSNSFAGAITGAGGTVQFAGGSTILKSGTTATVSNLSETGATTVVALLESLNYGGTFTLGAGSKFDTASGDTLTLSGPAATIGGAVGGAGALAITGGTATLASGGAVYSSAWTVSGGSTDLVVNESFLYSAPFTLNSGATLTVQGVAGGYFALKGSATLASATVNGGNRFITEAATTVQTLTIGGTVEWMNEGGVTQSVGNVTVGDGAGDVASLLNVAGATYAISNDTGIGHGSSTASLFTNQGTFEKTGGTQTSTVSVSFSDSGAGTVTATSGTLAFSGPSNSFAGAITGAGGTVQFAGGVTNLRSGTTASVSNLSETGSGTTVTVLENLTYAGGFAEGAGAVFGIAAGETLTLEGTNTLSGTVDGPGAFDLSGGATTIDAGEAFYVSKWSILGAGTTVTANTNIAYGHAFSEAATDTLVLSGGYLLLTGTDTFSGGVVDGSKTLYTEGTTSVSDLTIGGTTTWDNTTAVTQNGGNVTIGNSSGTAARLINTATGTYAITSNNNVALGTSTASSITNLGLFEKTDGTGTSTISPAIANTGTILVSSGTLGLQRAVSGAGADTISGASTLEFDSSAALGQTIGFTGAGGTLDITSLGTFSSSTASSAAISGFDTTGGNDTIEVAGPWTFVGFTENGAGTQGSLTFANGGKDTSLTLLGDYNPLDFVPNVAGGHTSITYA